MNMLQNFISQYILVPEAFAQTLSVASLMANINKYLINPLITLMFIVAFVLFVWGLFNFFRAKSGGGDSEDGLERGKRHILWGIVGMVIMVSVFGIMQLIINTLGVKGVDPSSTDIGDLSTE